MKRTKFGSKLTLLASGVVALALGLASVPVTVDFEDWTVAKKDAEAGRSGGNGGTNGGGIGQAGAQTSPQDAAEPVFFVTTGAAQAQALTQALVTLNARYRATDPSAGEHLLDQLLDLAAERQELLASLIAAAPGEALKTALPVKLTRAMPAEVQAFLEQWLELEGELVVLHVDHEDPGQSRYLYFLETPSGERISLHFAAAPPGLLSGTAVSVSGLLLEAGDTAELGDTDGAMALESGETGVETLECCTGDGTAAASGPALPATLGEQRTLVVLVNFQDKPDEKPYTADFARSVVFGETSDFLLENSYGQTWLAGDVVGWVTIPLDSTVCDYWMLANLANEAAAAAGLDPAAYPRRIFAFPRNACGWAGRATVGGTMGYAWINGTLNLKVTAHELGHNFGLYHAVGLECGAAPIGDSCYRTGLGDPLDMMGLPNAGHFNAFQKDRLGWLGYGAAPPITTVETNGTYPVDPYETDGTIPKALKILQTTDPETGKRTWYYLEYRQAIGFDGFIADPASSVSADNVLNGVVFHTGSESGGNTSHLLDMTPESLWGADFNDPALVVGESFSDPEAGVTVTTDWTDAFGATVSVSFGPASCAPANPQVSLSPSESLWVQPGTPVTYTVSITNKDSAACTSSRFDLLVAVQNGWLAAFAGGSLTLAPGASGATTIEISSPISEADGFYDVIVTAENGADPTYTASATATYVVSAAVNQPPIAIDDSATTDAGVPVTVAVLANDWDPDGGALSVASVTQGTNGAVVFNAGGSVTYTPNAGFSGTDGFTYSISDGQGGSDAAGVTITVVAGNQAPVANDDSATTEEDIPVTIPVLANDGDPDGDPLTVTSIVQGANGFAAVNADGTVTYAPVAGFTGTDTFGYSVSDGQGGSASASVTVTVAAAANEPPLAVDDAAGTEEDTAVTIVVLANDSDPDGDPFTVAAVGQGAKGLVTLNADGTITYTPYRKSKGSDSFGYTIVDSAGNAASAMVSVLVKNAKANGGKGKNK